MQEDVPEYHYTVGPLPPSRLGRRWGWQLFRGERLVAAGWRLGERSALLAVRTAAARAAHERVGLYALRPERSVTDRHFVPGMSVGVVCGAIALRLVPRELAVAPQARAAGGCGAAEGRASRWGRPGRGIHSAAASARTEMTIEMTNASV
jgi:hypothetical protein